MDTHEFQEIIYAHYAKAGRQFPWRGAASPWGVLVSELMLQQTQTERVVPYWERWMAKWPSPERLAGAGLDEVLREWNGLGYNRRAKYLHDGAKQITHKHSGTVPQTRAELLNLPGIGHYTAGAIACFAYNAPELFIETNIRSVLLHFFFESQTDKIDDKLLLPILEQSLDRENPRRWYYALMDYGAALKRTVVNPNRKSSHYTRQSTFKGSFRQIRGAIIRALVKDGPACAKVIQEHLDIPIDAQALRKALDALCKDQLLTCRDGVYYIGT
ncbi:HhH-GPD family protein [Breznakiellaceae bacterium SP9]